MHHCDCRFLALISFYAQDFKGTEPGRQLGTGDNPDAPVRRRARSPNSLSTLAWHGEPRIISGDKNKRRFTSPS